MLRRVPRITAGTTGQAARAAMANAPVWNFPSPTSGVKVPSGKNTSEWPLAAVRNTRRASVPPLWRLKRSTNSEPMRRSNRPRDRHLVHFALDHEAEARRQGGGHDHAVEIARVVGDHHALARGQVFAAAQFAAACRPAGKNVLAAMRAVPRRSRSVGSRMTPSRAIDGDSQEQQ